MKNFILLIILGCFSIYGFAVTPIDPPAKKGEPVKTSTPQSPVATEECSDLYSLVPVTVRVTIADCPDYDCSLPGPTCDIQLCVYQDNCNGSPLACTTFNPDTCSYTFEVRAEEYHYVYSHLVVTGCTNSWSTGCNRSTLSVPLGGGTVYIDDQLFCP
ncbi:MAG: hypothetical protein ISS19_15835 [Bacteroidales bacterium]|nr:hypothetical protein [Bacteroidales bacterium]